MEVSDVLLRLSGNLRKTYTKATTTSPPPDGTVKICRVTLAIFPFQVWVPMISQPASCQSCVDFLSPTQSQVRRYAATRNEMKSARDTECNAGLCRSMIGIRRMGVRNHPPVIARETLRHASASFPMNRPKPPADGFLPRPFPA